jgi:hypothetical protein
METKNVVIAMLCASIVILSIAAPISAVELENSGISGEIDGTGEVTGSVSLEASTDRSGTAEIEASIEVSVELVGDGSAKASQKGPVTNTLDTPLGTIVVDVSKDSNVNAAVAVDGDGKASADAYVGTTASLGESEVDIESEISSEAHVETDGGSASATASATGTTTGDGISYATGCPPAENDATSYAEVSGNTEANAAVSGTAGADSYAAVGSTDYAGHYTVEEDSYIESGSSAWSGDDNCESDDGSQASADSSANGEAYQYGQAENCASSNTYAEGEVSTAVATQGVAEAESEVYIWSYGVAESYGEAEEDTDYAYVEVDSDIDADVDAKSGTDGIASAEAYADGDTGAAGSACTCVYSDTSAIGIVSTAVETQGNAEADSDAYIWSYGEAEKDTDYAYVYGDSDMDVDSGAESGTDGIASAESYSIGYTGAAGSACDCVHLDTSAIGIVYTAAETQGDAEADSDAWLWSYGDAEKDGDYAYVDEDSEIWTDSDAMSGTDGIASAMSYSIGYTGAAGSACDCVHLDTSAIGIGYTAVQTEGDASADSVSDIWSDGDAEKDGDYAYVDEDSEIWTDSEADSDTDGIASAKSYSIGYTGAAGSACGCVYSDTSAIGIGSTAVQTEGEAYAESESDIWSSDYAFKDTEGAYVEEYSEIWSYSDVGSETDGKASAESSSKGYTGATGSACDCLDSWTNAKGAVEVKTETDGDAWITADARLTSDGWIVIGDQMRANSVINTSATAMHNSNSAGTATADGSTEANASDSCAGCTGEWVETGILDGDGDTVVNPFDVMNTWAFAGFAYANAEPTGFEAIVVDFDINTLGPIENVAYSSIDAIAMIPAPAP